MNSSGDFNWVCQALKDVAYTLRDMIRTPTEGILVVPRWPSAVFWNIIRGQDCANMFDSVSGIKLLGLVFDSWLTEYMSNYFRFFLVKASLYSMHCILCKVFYALQFMIIVHSIL